MRRWFVWMLVIALLAPASAARAQAPSVTVYSSVD